MSHTLVAMPIRAVTFDVEEHDLHAVVAAIDDRYTLGLVTKSDRAARVFDTDVFAFRLFAGPMGIAMADPRLYTMAAAAVPCRPPELVHVTDGDAQDVAAPRMAGARSVWLHRTGRPSGEQMADATISRLAELLAVLAAFDATSSAEQEAIGVGPHPQPWPNDVRLDPALLAGGDRRNVVDRYRYWRTEAVVADLDERRHPFHVAIENWQHDLNIGTVVRNANAFLASSIGVVGRRRWNRRGAMVTDRYQHVEHHADIDALIRWALREHLTIVAVDNLPGAVPIDCVELPLRCVLLFGQEGTGLSDAARGAAQLVCSIRQFGSTRSINAGVASGIAMHAWTTQHAHPD